MLRLRGQRLESGVAFGSACVLRAPNGIPLLPASLITQMARAKPGVPLDPMDVILVAPDYESAASLALPWATVIGIVAERAADDIRTNGRTRGVPALIGIPDVVAAVADDALLLLDADRGLLLVDPDPEIVAGYQAEHDRIAPRRRVYLDYAHQPAQTLDGREIHVLARTETWEQVRQGVEAGADALYVPADTLIPADTVDEEQLDLLLRLVTEAGSKPVTLVGSVEDLALSALLQAAVRGEFTLALPLHEGMEAYHAFLEYLRETQETLMEQQTAQADIHFAGWFPANAPPTDDLALFRIGRLIVEADTEIDTPENQEAWGHLTQQATELLLPVERVLPEATTEAVENAVRVGAAGLIVTPDAVQRVKACLREMDVSEVRARYQIDTLPIVE